MLYSKRAASAPTIDRPPPPRRAVTFNALDKGLASIRERNHRGPPANPYYDCATPTACAG
jgi:hypothetical protein